MGALQAAFGGRCQRASQYNPGVADTSSIDQLLATLNAADVGSLDAIAAKMRQVEQELSAMGQADLAEAAAGAVAALGRGEVAEFRRGRAFLQSKIGHLR
jgi:hypothetical protein